MSQLNTGDEGMSETPLSAATYALATNVSDGVHKNLPVRITEDEFHQGISEGKRLFSDFLAVMIHHFPNDRYFMSLLMVFEHPHFGSCLVGPTARLHLIASRTPKGSKERQLFLEMQRMLAIGRGEPISYEGINYSIYSFQSPEGRGSVTESAWYLLYHISRQHPGYLNIDQFQ